MSRSTVAYRCVVVTLAWPSHWLIVTMSTPARSRWDGRAVPHAVGMEAFATQGRYRGLGAGAVLPQQVADAESGQPHPAVIAEDRLVGLQLATALGQQGAQ